MPVVADGMPLKRQFFAAYNKTKRQSPVVLALAALMPKCLIK